jgi:tellurium resistance protein TerD
MALSLSKGGNISLTRTSPGLKNILIGLGWDARTSSGDDFDLDSSAEIVRFDLSEN